MKLLTMCIDKKYDIIKNTNVVGTIEVADFALSGKVKPLYNVSSCATSLLEDCSENPTPIGLVNGYAQTKYVTEQIILRLVEQGYPWVNYRLGYLYTLRVANIEKNTPLNKLFTLFPVSEPVISVRNLNHYFGSGMLRKQVLFDINLDIQPGEIVIMTGPSGSGKTTLLTLMGGLRSAQEGSLKILGQEICKANKQQLTKLRRQIGYIFQAHNLMTFLTTQENVRMSLELHDEYLNHNINNKAIAMLESVGLADRISYYPENLSGGQKQRVAIARALVSQPKIVLADEPTAALDKKSGRDVVELMQKLAKEQGCTILLVTHDNRILDIADRIIYMEDGQLKDVNITAKIQ